MIKEFGVQVIGDTGSVWRFLKLADDRMYIDNKEYFVESLERILGILIHMVSVEVNIED